MEYFVQGQTKNFAQWPSIEERMIKNNDNEGKLLLRGGEVAEMLGISRALAYRWAQTGVLPSVRVGRSVRVPHDGLLLWIARNTQNSPGVAA